MSSGERTILIRLGTIGGCIGESYQSGTLLTLRMTRAGHRVAVHAFVRADFGYATNLSYTSVAAVMSWHAIPIESKTTVAFGFTGRCRRGLRPVRRRFRH